MTIPAILSGVILYVLVAAACAGVAKRLGWLEPRREPWDIVAGIFCVAFWPIGWTVLAAGWLPIWFFGPMVGAIYRLTSGERRGR